MPNVTKSELRFQPRTSVLLADDHTLVRYALRRLLETHGLSVMEAANGRDAVAVARAEKPNLAVLDVAMPPTNGFDAAREICRAVPGILVIMLSGLSEPNMEESARKAGACGFVPKSASAAELMRAIDSALAGRSYAQPTAVTENAAHPSLTPLSAREKQVLELVAHGLTGLQIGLQLGISRRTAETHRANGMRKINVGSIAELARLYALRDTGQN